MDKFDVTIEKREFDHNLISHVARCVAAALARSLCECKMLCSVRTYSAQTGNWQARKQTQPVPDPVPAGTGSSWTASFANNTVLHAEPVRATVCGWYGGTQAVPVGSKCSNKRCCDVHSNVRINAVTFTRAGISLRVSAASRPQRASCGID